MKSSDAAPSCVCLKFVASADALCKLKERCDRMALEQATACTMHVWLLLHMHIFI